MTPPAAQSAYTELLLRTREIGFAAGRAELQRMANALRRAKADLQAIASAHHDDILRERAIAIRAEIQNVLEGLTGRLATGIASAQEQTVTQVVRAHEETARGILESVGAGTAGVRSRFGVLPGEILDVLAARRGGTAATFRTLMNRHMLEAGPVLDEMLIAGIARGQGIGSLTTAVAQLLSGQIPTNAAFNLPRMGGLRSVMYDARRIARSETMNALREANNLALDRSSLVEAAKWQTNSAHKQEDACDELASAPSRWGKGYHALKAWPLGPHPHCGCYQGAVAFKPVSQWGEGLAKSGDVSPPKGPAAVPGRGKLKIINEPVKPGGIGEDGRFTWNAAKSKNTFTPKYVEATNARLAERGLTGRDIVEGMVGAPEGSNWQAIITRIDSHNATGENFVVNVQITDLDNFKRVATINRSFNLDTGNVHHDLFTVENAYRGMGKATLRAQVELYDKLGITEIETLANLEIGGYAWARYGFVPTSDSWADLGRILPIQASRLRIAGDDLAFIRTALGNPDPAAGIRAIAGNPAGKDVLLGRSWNGLLDLSDPLSRALFDAYTTGAQ